jgi:hypothetical protein
VSSRKRAKNSNSISHSANVEARLRVVKSTIARSSREVSKMTVAELIEKLMDFPMDAPVFAVHAESDEYGEEYTIKRKPDPYKGVFGEVWI